MKVKKAELLRNYMIVSLAWNNPSKTPLTVEDAIRLLRDIIQALKHKPRSKLYRRAAILMDDIVFNAESKEASNER